MFTHLKERPMNTSTATLTSNVRHPLPTVVGVALAILAPPLSSFVVMPAFKPLVGPLYGLLGTLFNWSLILSLVGITTLWARQPLASLGLRPLAWQWAVLAGALGVLLAPALPVLTLLAQHLLPPTPSTVAADPFAAIPVGWLALGIGTAVIMEEVVYRAYLIERSAQLTGSVWPGALVGLALFAGMHLGGWNLAQVVGDVLPFGALLTALYLWRRNLLFVVIVHLLLDLPLILIPLGLLPQR